MSKFLDLDDVTFKNSEAHVHLLNKDNISHVYSMNEGTYWVLVIKLINGSALKYKCSSEEEIKEKVVFLKQNLM
jgi:hypothetical protein